jgi:hypothetical protein
MATLVPAPRILTVAMAGTFLVMRAYLHWSPNTDFNVGGYNVHHLFTGVLLIAVGGIPAVSVPLSSRSRAIATAGFGAGLAMALDEWVYLIATDGTNAEYIQPLSLAGGALMVGLACGYALALGHGCRRRGPVWQADGE